MNTLQEFKKFALKGNAIDLAVGVVIGAAFSGIVTSLVQDIINPPLGLITGNIDFRDKVVILRAATETMPAVTLNYGAFITALINFVIVAFAIFIIVKQINRLKDKEEAKPAETKTVSEEVKLLTEIRDLLGRK